MAKTDRNAQRQAARQAAAARLRHAQARRKRMVVAGTAIGTVLLVLVVLVVVRLVGGGSEAEPQRGTEVASPQLLAAVTGVPPATLDQIGAGTVNGLPRAITGQLALTRDGKPLVLYVGAEFCPFCAAQRWAVVTALARFGTFTDLKVSHSASDDVHPNTATLSFHGASYTSQYLAFDGVETRSNVRQGNGYAPLDSLTAEQTRVLQTYNAPPYVPADSAGSIPFLDLGNQYILAGSSFSPELLAGLSADEIAGKLATPDDPIAKAVGGSANALTTALCKLTGGAPANVCASGAATAYQDKL